MEKIAVRIHQTIQHSFCTTYLSSIELTLMLRLLFPIDETLVFGVLVLGVGGPRDPTLVLGVLEPVELEQIKY